MKTKDILLQLILEDPGRDTEWATTSAKILRSPHSRISDSYPGISCAKDALATLRVHKNTTQANKIKTLGIEETIKRLESVRPDSRLLVFGLFMERQSILLHVGVSADTINLVGCVFIEGKVIE